MKIMVINLRDGSKFITTSLNIIDNAVRTIRNGSVSNIEPDIDIHETFANPMPEREVYKESRTYGEDYTYNDYRVDKAFADAKIPSPSSGVNDNMYRDDDMFSNGRFLFVLYDDGCGKRVCGEFISDNGRIRVLSKCPALDVCESGGGR